MHQNVLIVFISFLLVTILLLLLLGDAREKSKRIRVFIDLSGNPDENQLLQKINPLLQQMAAEGLVYFILNDENQFSGSEPVGAYTVILKIYAQNNGTENNEIQIFHAERHRIHLFLALPEALDHDPVFLQQIVEAVTQAGKPQKPA